MKYEIRLKGNCKAFFHNTNTNTKYVDALPIDSVPLCVSLTPLSKAFSSRSVESSLTVWMMGNDGTASMRLWNDDNAALMEAFMGHMDYSFPWTGIEANPPLQEAPLPPPILTALRPHSTRTRSSSGCRLWWKEP